MRPARDLVLACIWSALAALAGCGDTKPPDRASLALADCRLPKLAQAARCATLEVPENRAQPGARDIGVFVAVLPANTANPRPDPFVIVAGGPGQAATQLAPFASRLAEIRRTRDIVLVDQRGTGRSSPLRCAAFEPGEDAVALLEADLAPRARECALELAADGIDLTQYTTANWVDDLEAMRAALGYAKLNLWGGSYGTRVVLEYVRRHPTRVRSIVLDGVAPPDLRTPVDVWPTRERALDGVLAACRASPGCSASHPDLGTALDALLADLGRNARRVRVPDPRTGAMIEIALTPDMLLVGLLPLTYSAELAALIPELVARAVAGDHAPLVAAARLLEGSPTERVNAALHYSVVCSEDAPRVSQSDLRALAGTRTHSLAQKVLSVCDAWPRAPHNPTPPKPLESDVPALILSGALDPVTPPEYGDRVAKTLSRSRHVVAAGHAHVISPHGCTPRLLAAFVADAGFDRLPETCLRHLAGSARPLLWPDRFGPVP